MGMCGEAASWGSRDSSRQFCGACREDGVGQNPGEIGSMISREVGIRFRLIVAVLVVVVVVVVVVVMVVVG